MNAAVTQALIDQLWDFDDPAASEAKFCEAIEQASCESQRLELQTQLARAQGLQRKFDVAHATLDAVFASLAPHGNAAPGRADFATARVRYLLERGRVLNSSNRRDDAMPLFEQAFDAATTISDDHLAIDAAHMIAIVHGSKGRAADAMQWNLRALQLAELSAQPRARLWRASLHNNVGWILHEQGDFAAALTQFETALQLRQQQGKPRDIRVAYWCIARCLRSLNRIEQSLSIQQSLQRQCEATGERTDGCIHQEIGECFLALNRPADAALHLELAKEFGV